MPRAERPGFLCDYMSMWEAAANGINPKKNIERQKYWNHWKTTLQPQASTHSLTSQFLLTNVKLLQENLLLGSGQEAMDEEIRSNFQVSRMLS